MIDRAIRMDRVEVTPAYTFTRDVALLDQLRKDPVRGSLGDADRLPDLAKANARLAGNAKEHLGVVSEKGQPDHRLCMNFVKGS